MNVFSAGFILLLSVISALGNTVVYESDEQRLTGSRQARSAAADHPSSVCIDVVSFVKDLDKTKMFCREPRFRSFCETQLRRLGNQVQMATADGKGSIDNSMILHRQIASQAAQGGLRRGQAKKVNSKQELRNVTFHLAVFCASHPIFCHHQLASSIHSISRRSAEQNSLSSESFRATARRHDENELLSGTDRRSSDNTEHRSNTEPTEQHRWLRNLADQNGDGSISSSEWSLFKRARRQLQRLMDKAIST